MKSRTLLELHSYDSICLQYTSNTFDIFIIFTFSISISAVFILPVLLASQKPSSGYSLYFNISFVFFFHLSFVELVSFCFCFFILLVFFNSTHIKSLTKYVSIFFFFLCAKMLQYFKTLFMAHFFPKEFGCVLFVRWLERVVSYFGDGQLFPNKSFFVLLAPVCIECSQKQTRSRIVVKVISCNAVHISNNKELFYRKVCSIQMS